MHQIKIESVKWTDNAIAFYWGLPIALLENQNKDSIWEEIVCLGDAG